MLKDEVNEIIQFMMQQRESEIRQRDEYIKEFPGKIPVNFYDGFKSGYSKCLDHMRDYIVYLIAKDKDNVDS